MTLRLGFAFTLASITVALAPGCSSRETTTTDDAAVVRDGASLVDGPPVGDVGTGASDAARVDASRTRDTGVDAFAAEDAFLGTDTSVPPSDGGCAPPVCPPLPGGCHYEGTTECRCGVVVCEPPTGNCTPACAADEFCEFPAGTCGATGSGTCTAVPFICPDLYLPVCGCDGMTYSNACMAQSAGQNVAFDGECPTPADCLTAGCPSGSSCHVCRGTGPICIPDGTVC